MNNSLIKMLSLVITFGSFFISADSQQAWTIYNTSNSGLPINTVRCIKVDAQNKKWVGTDFGLAVFDDVNWTIYNTSNSGLPENNVRALNFDEQGNIWIGTLGGGVAKFDGSSTWTVYDPANSGLPSYFIRSIAFDTAGNKWFGTSSGLVKFDDTTWSVWDIYNSNMISHHVTSVVIDRNNIKYFGTVNGGLYHFNDTNFTVFSLWTNNLPDNSILSIALDSSDVRWLGMPSAGLMEHYGGPAVWYNISTSNIPTDAISCVYVATNQTKYLGTQNKGMVIYSGNNNFIFFDSTNSPLPDDNVFSVVRDTGNIVWIGCSTGGLVRLDESALNGISENNGSNSPIQIFPNPNQGQFTVHWNSYNTELYDIHVLDLEGREVYSSSQNTNSITIDIALAPGMYFVEIYTKGSKCVGKMIVN